MEQKFGINSIDIQELHDFCKQEGEIVDYRKGEQMEYEGKSAQWFGFVTKGCFKYVTQGISDGKEHITCGRLSQLHRRKPIADHDRSNDA